MAVIIQSPPNAAATTPAERRRRLDDLFTELRAALSGMRDPDPTLMETVMRSVALQHPPAEALIAVARQHDHLVREQTRQIDRLFDLLVRLVRA